ncbi:hypothetical protein E2C01_049779 [Portunus trituberculatus]|uniref:Uncharacterized protein n=1 Tax=Portunus trituberculatus TaxID=210409 RepID=A0A5B7GH09_PORTR|nr:hypothetical protein [Portunus trituberculatus]
MCSEEIKDECQRSRVRLTNFTRKKEKEEKWKCKEKKTIRVVLVPLHPLPSSAADRLHSTLSPSLPRAPTLHTPRSSCLGLRYFYLTYTLLLPTTPTHTPSHSHTFSLSHLQQASPSIYVYTVTCFALRLRLRAV